MNFTLPSPATLVLEDGTVFTGYAQGFRGTSTGEICFNTGMTGYQEIFTDPSYLGQIMVATHVHIGNYGVHEDDVESDTVKISGLVCRAFEMHPSRKQSHETLTAYFERHKIVAISGVDTRALVRHIRHKGAMNAIISNDGTPVSTLQNLVKQIPSMKGLELASKVSTPQPYTVGNPNAKYKVAVLDLGVKRSILTCLTNNDCYCKVFPLHTPLNELEVWQPDGYLLSNGPGDPEPLTQVIELARHLIHSGKKVMGICLGHQIISWSVGVPTYKMFNGHRGINHPILNLETQRGEITSQNHGFVIDPQALANNPDVVITHQHLNDQSIAGIRIQNKSVFSVQYHPEAGPGPHDARYLFKQFVDMMAS